MVWALLWQRFILTHMEYWSSPLQSSVSISWCMLSMFWSKYNKFFRIYSKYVVILTECGTLWSVCNYLGSENGISGESHVVINIIWIKSNLYNHMRNMLVVLISWIGNIWKVSCLQIIVTEHAAHLEISQMTTEGILILTSVLAASNSRTSAMLNIMTHWRSWGTWLHSSSIRDQVVDFFHWRDTLRTVTATEVVQVHAPQHIV